MRFFNIDWGEAALCKRSFNETSVAYFLLKYTYILLSWLQTLETT